MNDRKMTSLKTKKALLRMLSFVMGALVLSFSFSACFSPAYRTEVSVFTREDMGKTGSADNGPEASASEPSPAPTASPEPSPEPTAEPTPEPTPTPGPVTVKLMFVGDLMCLAGQQYRARENAKGTGEEYDFSPSFRYVRELISGADCAFGNLETTLSSSWPYASQEKFIGGKQNCNAPKEFLGGLKYAGFDVLSLANNHCLDAETEGIIETLDAVEEYGFYHNGLFRSPDEKRYTIIDVNGVKIGFMAYTDRYNGKEWKVRGCEYMVNTVSEETVRADAAAARADGADLIVAYFHWGHEHINYPPGDVIEKASVYADAGVDIIAGAHSHAVQPVEWLEASDGRQVLCMYSLGNFISSLSQPTANDTFIEEISVTKEFGGTVTLSDERIHTCRVFAAVGSEWYVVVPTDCGELSSVRRALAEAEERIMNIVLSRRKS